ncbi:MAG: hypothetical protein ACI9R3_000566 [Verrucomicrobiales bacterium]|jgi:hypothetical protein
MPGRSQWEYRDALDFRRGTLAFVSETKLPRAGFWKVEIRDHRLATVGKDLNTGDIDQQAECHFAYILHSEIVRHSSKWAPSSFLEVISAFSW